MLYMRLRNFCKKGSKETILSPSKCFDWGHTPEPMIEAYVDCSKDSIRGFRVSQSEIRLYQNSIPRCNKIRRYDQLTGVESIIDPHFYKSLLNFAVRLVLWCKYTHMEDKINAFGTSCYRIMLNIKRIDRVTNVYIYNLTKTTPLVERARARQLKFLGHILRMPAEEPCREYAIYVPKHGKRKPGRQRTLFLKYTQCLLGDLNDMLDQQQLLAMAQDRCSWRKLVVACSAAERWWWWWHPFIVGQDFGTHLTSGHKPQIRVLRVFDCSCLDAVSDQSYMIANKRGHSRSISHSILMTLRNLRNLACNFKTVDMLMCTMFLVLHFWMIWTLYSIPSKMATNPKHGWPLFCSLSCKPNATGQQFCQEISVQDK